MIRSLLVFLLGCGDADPDDTVVGDTAPVEDTADSSTPCVPEVEIVGDGVDQDCDGWADELGVGVAASSLASHIMVGDRHRALGYAVDAAIVGGVPWLAATGFGYDTIQGRALVEIGVPDGVIDLTVDGPGSYDYFGEDVAVGDWAGGPLVVMHYAMQETMAFGGTGALTAQDAFAVIQRGGLRVEVGEITGDGVDDVVLRGHREAGLGVFEGPLVAGSFGEPVLEILMPEDRSMMIGWSLGEIGDLTGDGVAEITTIGTDDAVYGHAWIFPGEARGSFVAGDIGWSLVGEQPDDGAGAVIALGDVTGDGYLDLLASAPKAHDRTGVAYLVAGPITEDGALADGIARFEGLRSRDACGGVETLPDVDGDDADEVVVTCPNNYLLPGRVEIHAGADASGTRTAHDARLVLVGGAPGDAFGASLTADADLTGDGRVDLVVGAPNDESADVGAGAVFLFSGPWW